MMHNAIRNSNYIMVTTHTKKKKKKGYGLYSHMLVTIQKNKKIKRLRVVFSYAWLSII